MPFLPPNWQMWANIYKTILLEQEKQQKKRTKKFVIERYKKRGSALWNQAEVCPNGCACECELKQKKHGDEPRVQCFSDEQACTWPNAISYFSSPRLPSLSSSTHRRWGCLLYWALEGLSLPHGPPPAKKKRNKQKKKQQTFITVTKPQLLVQS